MAEKQALPPDAPPPSYQQAMGYQGYGTSPRVPSYPGQTGYNTNYNANYDMGRQTVMLPQPTDFSGRMNYVPDHMGLAIFSTLLCCWPIGILAIHRAQEARRAQDSGDTPTAMKLSEQSRRHSLTAIKLGSAFIVIIVVVIVIILNSINDT